MKNIGKFIFCSCSIYLSLSIAKVPNINFDKKLIVLANQKIIVEIADTSEKAERGLMFRKSLRQNEGMLFIFPNERIRSFWMKNTFVDLSIGFFNKNKILIEMCDLKASSSELTKNPDLCETKKSAQFALEMSRGWYEKHNIKVGAKFSFSTSN